MFRRLLSRVGRAAGVVIHDPAVVRSARAFGVLIAVRLAIALGASVQMVELLRSLLG